METILSGERHVGYDPAERLWSPERTGVCLEGDAAIIDCPLPAGMDAREPAISASGGLSDVGLTHAQSVSGGPDPNCNPSVIARLLHVPFETDHLIGLVNTLQSVASFEPLVVDAGTSTLVLPTRIETVLAGRQES